MPKKLSRRFLRLSSVLKLLCKVCVGVPSFLTHSLSHFPKPVCVKHTRHFKPFKNHFKTLFKRALAFS